MRFCREAQVDVLQCYAMAVNEKLLLYHVHQFLRENNLVQTLRRGDHGEALGILFEEGNTFRHVYHGILGMNFLFVMDLVVEVLETVLVVRQDPEIIYSWSVSQGTTSKAVVQLDSKTCLKDHRKRRDDYYHRSGLVPLVDAIQERDTILKYTHHNRLHVYVSRVELSPLIVEEQHSMKQIKNDYHTNVMYDIAKVAGKLQIFVSHTQIDLSTVLIPNDGSLEESFAAQYKLEIYIDHIGVDFVISKYIFPNASLAEMMNHVITDYSSENEGIIRQETQNDYTFNKMVEWAEQEHFEYEETKTSHTISPISTMLSSTIESCLSYTHFFSPLTYYMAYGANEARQAIVLKLQREIQAEETLADQLSCNLARYTEETQTLRFNCPYETTRTTDEEAIFGEQILALDASAIADRFTDLM
ncbi:hypothetical protein Tco_0658035 [Tanacetum coccineum]